MSPETLQFIAQIMVGGGGLALLGSAGRAVWKRVTGRAGREKIRNTSLLSQRDAADARAVKAYAERDEEASKRRIIQEYASGLRVRLIEAGIEPDEWPIDTRTQQPPRDGEKKRRIPAAE